MCSIVCVVCKLYIKGNKEVGGAKPEHKLTVIEMAPRIYGGLVKDGKKWKNGKCKYRILLVRLRFQPRVPEPTELQ